MRLTQGLVDYRSTDDAKAGLVEPPPLDAYGYPVGGRAEVPAEPVEVPQEGWYAPPPPGPRPAPALARPLPRRRAVPSSPGPSRPPSPLPPPRPESRPARTRDDVPGHPCRTAGRRRRPAC